MAELIWGNPGERYFEAGVDRGVLYLPGEEGVAWNGLISVSESPSGGEAEPYYLDGVKYANRASTEEFAASIEAYTYPDEFAVCDGTASLEQETRGLFATQQKRKPFGLSYRTRVGNDGDSTDHAYKIHIVYNAMANPSERNYQTLSDEAEAMPFSWDITATPMPIPGLYYSAHLMVDSRNAYPWAIAAIEKVLYGSEDTPPTLPTPQELIDLFVENALLKITDNGDGTWTADGPSEILTMLSATEFQISWPSANYIDSSSYTISSL
jgi:hypothetical protein